MKVISVVNFKGGTGKSSLCENLAIYLGSLRKKVVVLDGDRQRNSTGTLLGGWYPNPEKPMEQPTLKEVIEGTAPLEKAMYQARYQDLIAEDLDSEEKNVYEERERTNVLVVPSHTDLEKASVFLSANRKAFYIVRNALRNLSEKPDVVFVDQAGAYSPVMEALLLASDGILIPCQLEPYCVRGIFDMYAKLQGELPDHALANYGIIPYAVNRSKVMTLQYLDELREQFGDLVIQSVCTDANVPKAQSCFETIMEYRPRPSMKTFTSSSQPDFLALAQQIKAIIEDGA